MQNKSPSNTHQRCYIGLTQWQHSAWQASLLLRSRHQHLLNAYSRHFSSVEGNSTFYALPQADTINQWKIESSDTFKFCFKFPQQITHQRQLKHCANETVEFLNRIKPLEEKLGLLCIQLPENFNLNALENLSKFLETLSSDFEYAVEIRNLCFFDKKETEKTFNQLLYRHNINRISFDTRALFTSQANDIHTLKAQAHKPKLPVHAITTGNSPMVRFISAQDWLSSHSYLEPWVNKATQWIKEGKTPYFFFHTPDNAHAPELASLFVSLLEEQLLNCCLFSPWPSAKEQPSLF